MFKIKRDYLISLKKLVGVYFLVIIGVFLLSFVESYNNDFKSGLYVFVSQIVTIGTATIAAAPATIIFCITPIDLKFDDGLVPTMHLPLSKKQILWNGLKGILPYFIIWIIATNLITTILKTNISNEAFNSVYFKEIFNSLKTISVVVMIELQVMAATILAYTKDIKWYKVVPIQILLNVVIVFACYSLLNIINFDMTKDMAWYRILVGCVAIFSFIEFIYSFRYIEEVCR